MTPHLDLFLTIDEGGADLVLEGGDLKPESGLRTAALLSMATDQRAPDDALALRPELAGDARGWWGDASGDAWGSLLWLLYRDKVGPGSRERARSYGRDAFAWMVEEQIAEEVNVEARLQAGALLLEVQPHRGTSELWRHVWEGTEAIPFGAPGVDVVLTFS